MFRFPDWCFRLIPSNHKIWISLWAIWFITLWFLSSGNPGLDNGPKIPHLDKIAHFCYFMAGGFCFANFLYLNNSLQWSWLRIIILTVLLGATVGAIDEYHQTKTPGRTGNDLGDWTADTSGTLAGAFYCYFMWRRLKKVQTKEI